ncbi:MAG: hypothetical protein IMY71_11490 [Bacteroidetes bacterium]|nr:hypothetical protein [Bacteroidota bacterium]
MRKTVEITELKEAMNDYLANECLESRTRIDAAGTFDFLLMDIGIYSGFTFLPDEADICDGIYGKEGKIKFC